MKKLSPRRVWADKHFEPVIFGMTVIGASDEDQYSVETCGWCVPPKAIFVSTFDDNSPDDRRSVVAGSLIIDWKCVGLHFLAVDFNLDRANIHQD